MFWAIRVQREYRDRLSEVEAWSSLLNAFHHAVFARPDNYINDGPGATGVITSTVVPQSEIQFALKLHF